MSNLTKLNRDELNAEATRLGIENPDQLQNMPAVIEAIEGNDAYRAEQAAADVEAANDAGQEPKPGVFIVNGVKVDYNGVPVKG